ncbi:MAG: STAS domain-containing protein [Planctomycetes bacterium]|jgi:hypothetical protein|nr:STAS domain-containing protein [Planctomycetota bacterium]
MTPEGREGEPRREVAWDTGPGGAPVGRVSGLLDRECARILSERAVSLPSGGRLVLDLRAVEYISSSGIGELVALASRVRVVLAGAPEPVLSRLRLAEALPLLEVERGTGETGGAGGRTPA